MMIKGCPKNEWLLIQCVQLLFRFRQRQTHMRPRTRPHTTDLQKNNSTQFINN